MALQAFKIRKGIPPPPVLPLSPAKKAQVAAAKVIAAVQMNPGDTALLIPNEVLGKLVTMGEADHGRPPVSMLRLLVGVAWKNFKDTGDPFQPLDKSK
jgi:hypothetical protein